MPFEHARRVEVPGWRAPSPDRYRAREKRVLNGQRDDRSSTAGRSCEDAGAVVARASADGRQAVSPLENYAPLTKVLARNYPPFSHPTRRNSPTYGRTIASGRRLAYRWTVRDQAGGLVEMEIVRLERAVAADKPADSKESLRGVAHRLVVDDRNQQLLPDSDAPTPVSTPHGPGWRDLSDIATWSPRGGSVPPAARVHGARALHRRRAPVRHVVHHLPPRRGPDEQTLVVARP